VRSGARVGVARAPVAPTTLAFSPDDTRLVGGGPDGLARMWTVGGRTIKTLRQAPRASDESVDAIAFSPRGNVLMTSGDDGTVKLWNASTERRLRIIRADTAAPPKYFQGVSASFSPDGSRILTSTYWGVKARIWDAQTGALQLELEGHAGGIGSSSWSPDGKFALTVGFDGTVRVWDASNGQPLLVVHAAPTGRLGGNGGAVFADFAGADDRIATLGEDGVIHLYACDVCGDVNHLLQLATKRTTRGLTSQEQRVYLHKS
jgi:WD40 repeat protein